MSSSSDSSSAPATSVAVVVSSRPAQRNSNVLSLAIWACRPRARQSREDPWRYTLQHYTVWDDARQFTHLDCLLTALAPLNVVYITSSNSESSPNKKGNAAAVRLEQLQDFLNRRTDLQQNDDADTGLSLCQIAQAPPRSTWNQVDAAMSQLLVDDGAVLAFRGDVVSQENPLLQQALALWLDAQGLLKQSCGNDMERAIKVEAGTLNSHLTMDRTVAQCIHLWPPANAGLAHVVGGNAHNNSLLGLLGQPLCSPMGRRMLELWLRQPLVQLDQLQQRQDVVACLYHQGLLRDGIRAGLQSFRGTDLDHLALQLGKYRATSDNEDSPDAVGSTKAVLQCLYQLYLVSESKLPAVLQGLEPEESGAVDNPVLQSLRTGLQAVSAELLRAQELAEAVLDLDEAPREFRVKATYKEELQQVHEELQELEEQVQECHETMRDLWAEWSGSKTSAEVRLERNDDDFQFRLPNSNDIKTLQAQKGITVHRILKNGVYFTSKELRQLASKRQDLQLEYDRHQRELVKNAIQVAATYQPVLERTSELIAQLDVFCSLAHVAAFSSNGYCQPTMTDSDEDGAGIELKGARHPCVELQENMDYIPNDISLKFGESSFLLVTGPNMGGKSTYIRALGAIVAMAQIGSFVPCQSAKINICHHILARVGAGDLQERGISTFMAEMLEASSILRTATKRSLIIIDELGRGTSTFDGYGLARAISEYIVQKIGCMTVFTTHFHELTALEQQEPCVKNCHVTARKGNQGLTFLYEVLPGPCLESFGIQVAEMANVPSVVIEDAKRKASELENFDDRKKSREDSADGDEEFIDRFRNLPLQSFLSSQYASEEEKKGALLQLLTGH